MEEPMAPSIGNCGKCGRFLPAGTAVCPRCGREVPGAVAVPPAPEEAEAADASDETDRPDRSSKKSRRRRRFGRGAEESEGAEGAEGSEEAEEAETRSRRDRRERRAPPPPSRLARLLRRVGPQTVLLLLLAGGYGFLAWRSYQLTKTAAEVAAADSLARRDLAKSRDDRMKCTGLLAAGALACLIGAATSLWFRVGGVGLALAAAALILPASYWGTSGMIENPALYVQGIILVVLIPTLLAVWAREKRRRELGGGRLGRRR